MENFIVSALKYRPQKFEDVIGQSSITKTLERAIKENHLAQALLFCGPRGVGKTTCARILAKEINLNSDDFDDNGSDFSFNIFELDAASNNSVDDIRSLTEQVRFAPQQGKYKVYIIDEVHMLSQAAFNAFLKTLEEPPPYAIFILATTEKHKIIPTILSRCQIYDFKRITIQDIISHLQKIANIEHITIDNDALYLIAQKADGALRDALSIFDRVVSFCGKNISLKDASENLNILDYDYYFSMVECFLKSDIKSSILLFDTILDKGFDAELFLSGLASHFRDILVSKDESTTKLLEVGNITKQKYLEQSQNCDLSFIIQSINVCSEHLTQYKSSQNKRLLIEITLMKLCSIKENGVKKKSKLKILSPQEANFDETTSSVKDKTTQLEKEVKTSENKTKIVEKTDSDEKSKKTKTPNNETSKTDINSVKTPIKSKSVIGISINSFLEEKTKQKDTKQEININNLPKNTFSQEKLERIWNEFAQSKKQKGEISYFTSLTISKPLIEKDFQINIEVPSEALLKDFNDKKSELTKYLNEKLDNFHIKINSKLGESTIEYKPYTKKEKLQAMIDKNPDIQILMRDLKLKS